MTKLPSAKDRLPAIQATVARIERLLIENGEEPLRFTEDVLKDLHRLATADDPGVTPGAYRNFEAEVVHRQPGGGTITVRCPPPVDIPRRMAKLTNFLNDAPARQQAVDGLKYFFQTHPFGDGNGRCGRALLALLLRASGLLNDADAATHLLYDYFERGGFKQRLGALIEPIVARGDNAPWNAYFAGLFEALASNGGHLPPIPTRETKHLTE